MNIQSLITLWNVTQMHPFTSGARASAGVLLGLYNGTRFPMNLIDLRHLDANHLTAAIEVISADATRCQHEVHDWLNLITGRTDFGARFEHLAHQYNCKRKAKKAELKTVSPAVLVLAQEWATPASCAAVTGA
jgi:hypothetical protein